MIEFVSLSLRNFLSYSNAPTIIQLQRSGTTLIVGEDLDNTTNGQGANGVGKSSLVNALTYAIYDKPISNISKDNLVNNINKKNMEVAVEFIANNRKRYIVARARKTKIGPAGNTVHLFEDGKDITPDSSTNTNILIEQIIGIPYELFVRIVVFSASHIPFLDLPTKSHYQANQTDIIEELFGLTILSTKANLLRDIIKDTESRLEIRKVKIEGLEKEHIRHAQQLDSANKRVETWNIQNKETIRLLCSKLKKIEAVDVEEQRMYHSTLSTFQNELSDTLEKKRLSEKHLKEIVKNLTENDHTLEHLRDATCPYCKQTYSDAHTKIGDCETQATQLLLDAERHEDALKLLTKLVGELSHNIKDVRQKITVENVEELIQIKNDSAVTKQRIDELETSINPFTEPLEELQNTKLDTLEYDEVNNITKILEHQRFLLKLLTKKDSFVRKALINKNIPYLNTRLQYYLTFLGLPHIVEFTHEMTAKISQFDRDLDFGNLSAGQRARVNLALSFAFRDVLQSIHTKINVCMLDEVLDIGLDTIGVQAAARLLKRKARDENLSLFIISHRDEIDGAFDRTLTVQLSKGFSYIKLND